MISNPSHFRRGCTSRLASAAAVAAGLLSAAPRAAAQNEVFDSAALASALSSWMSQAQDSGGRLEKPRDESPFDRRDAFQARQVEVKAGELREERPVGEYNQPQWTTFRRFPSTRIYLQTPPGGVQFEQWVQLRRKKDSSDPETRLSQELEFGLGHRLQLDLYMNELHVRDAQNSTYEWSGWAAEIRYALADWDEIWGNPTLYFEYIFNDQNHDGPDAIEPKLLLGGEIAPGWHWGANFIHERSIGGHDQAVIETAFTSSISHTIVDEVFSAGASTELKYESGPGTPREHELTFMAGPSFQLIPHPRAAFNLEPLIGLTGKALRSKIYIIFSWHF